MVLDEREQLRQREMVIRDRIREIDAEVERSVIARIMEGDCYFRFDDLQHSLRQNKNVYVHVLNVDTTPSGYSLFGIQVWPDIPRVERGSIGWTLHACRRAWEQPDTGEKITKSEFNTQFDTAVDKIKDVRIANGHR